MKRWLLATYALLGIAIGLREASKCLDAPLSIIPVAIRLVDNSYTPKNTAVNAKYIGTKECIDCHQDQYASYLRTTHSQSFASSQVDTEVAHGSFAHAPSHRSYVVDQVETQIFHREEILGTNNKPLAKTEFPIQYSVGSGTHAKSYLIQRGPFVIQSPLTWYRDLDGFAMSPGYDIQDHDSFRRTVGVGCVFCHAGQIEQKTRNPYLFAIKEEKIGCERCHGPGASHSQKQLASTNQEKIGGDSLDPKAVPTGAPVMDDSICNPARLSRERAEAVCQQCHLQGVVGIHRSGRNDWDFRPGMRLTDIRVDYQTRLKDQSMKIVGHVEQMHSSACYQKTETLTCTTCHDPHDPHTGKQSIDYYREKCLQCHEDNRCVTPVSERVAANENHCAACHMPRLKTNLSHVALHHHRIGIHNPESERADALGTDELGTGIQAVLDLESLPATEKLRIPALAAFRTIRLQTVANALPGKALAAVTEALLRCKKTGLMDAEVDAALAELAAGQGQREIATGLSRQVLATDLGMSPAWMTGANILASDAMQQQNSAVALPLYRKIVQNQRTAYDNYLLGVLEYQADNINGAVIAFQNAIEIQPEIPAPHVALQTIYRLQGKTELADRHAAILTTLKTFGKNAVKP